MNTLTRFLVSASALALAVSAQAYNGYYPAARTTKDFKTIVYDSGIEKDDNWECETMIAIKNNREGKKSDLTLSLTSEIDTVHVSFCWHNTDFGDFTDRRIVTLTVDSPTGACQPTTCDITQNVETGSGENIIALKSIDHRLDISIGSPTPLLRASVETSIAPKQIALTCTNEAAIEYFYTMSIPSPHKALETSLDTEEINRMLAMTGNDDACGIYEFYDRTFDPVRGRPGGLYKLAIIPSQTTEGRYDIIYLDGAKTNAHKWHTGMLKGRLKPTGLINQYRVEWYDSMLAKVEDDEMFALLSDDHMLLTINYPSVNAVIRFVRRPKEDRADNQ